MYWLIQQFNRSFFSLNYQLLKMHTSVHQAVYVHPVKHWLYPIQWWLKTIPRFDNSDLEFSTFEKQISCVWNLCTHLFLDLSCSLYLGFITIVLKNIEDNHMHNKSKGPKTGVITLNQNWVFNIITLNQNWVFNIITLNQNWEFNIITYWFKTVYLILSHWIKTENLISSHWIKTEYLILSHWIKTENLIFAETYIVYRSLIFVLLYCKHSYICSMLFLTFTPA